MEKNKEYVIGVDLGGTKIFAAVVDRDGKILATARKKTKVELGFDRVVRRIADCILQAARSAQIDIETQIKAIGIGSPGPLDLKEGKIISSHNLQWYDAPLKSALEGLLNKPVIVENDCNVGILGEQAYGAGRDAKHIVGLFIGTGIGGGIIVNDKLLHGYNDNAGEFGHVILNPNGPRCGCGNKGCLEAYSSRSAIEREIRRAIKKGQSSLIANSAEEKKEKLGSKKIAEAYSKGDSVVTNAINKSAQYIGYSVASILNTFNPQVVIIGGGLVEAIGEPYLEIVRKTAESNVFPIAMRNVKIVSAELKDDSAILGAAVLAMNGKM